LSAAPSASQILRRPARRFLLVGGCTAGFAGLSVEPHLCFAENKTAPLVRFIAPLENSTAKQSCLLHRNSVPPQKDQVSAYRELRPNPILSDVVECEDAQTHFVGESSEDVLHLIVPFSLVIRAS
jgi:hypothetical protein